MKAELYAAEQFADKAPAVPGLFRVRVDGRWFSPGGGKYEYFTAPDVFAALSLFWLGGDEAPANPNWPRRARVRVAADRNRHDFTLTWTICPPFQGPDRRWHVFLMGEDKPTPCDNLEFVYDHINHSTSGEGQ